MLILLHEYVFSKLLYLHQGLLEHFVETFISESDRNSAMEYQATTTMVVAHLNHHIVNCCERYLEVCLAQTL